jgi:hypothetical protein
VVIVPRFFKVSDFFKVSLSMRTERRRNWNIKNSSALRPYFVGVVLIYSAVTQWRKGETYGLSGKGKVYRDEEPGYFMMLFVGRIILGPISLACGLFLPW